MHTRLAGTIAVAALALTACGGGGGGGGGAQDDFADMFIELMNDVADAEGTDISIDEGCVRDATDRLSDHDAKAMVEAGADGEADISAEGEAIGASLFACVSIPGIDLGDPDLDGTGG